MKHETSNVLLSRSFVLSFCSFFPLWISFDFFILFPLFILQNGGNSVDVGIQEAIFFFPSVLMRPVAGWFTDRIGRLRLIWFGSFLMILTAFAFLLLHGSYQQMKWWISVILFTRGASFASFYTAFFTYVADLSVPENRARVIGLFGVSGLIAHGSAPYLAELVLGRYHFGGFFMISGALSALSLLLSAFLHEKRNVAHVTENALAILRKVTITKRNAIILPSAFAFGWVVASFNTFGAAYFKEAGVGSVGYFFLMYGFTAGFVRIVFGGIADRYHRERLVLVFFSLLGLGLCLIVLRPLQLFYLISAAICGASHGILFPTMTAMAVDAHPAQVRGVVTSVFTGMIELGFSLGSYVLGVVIAMTSYPSMFLSAAGLALAFSLYAAVFLYLNSRTTVRTPEAAGKFDI